MILTKFVHQGSSGPVHFWRLEMRYANGMARSATLVGVSDRYMREDPSSARAYVAGEIVKARRDVRRVCESLGGQVSMDSAQG